MSMIASPDITADHVSATTGNTFVLPTPLSHALVFAASLFNKKVVETPGSEEGLRSLITEIGVNDFDLSRIGSTKIQAKHGLISLTIDPSKEKNSVAVELEYSKTPVFTSICFLFANANEDVVVSSRIYTGQWPFRSHVTGAEWGESLTPIINLIRESEIPRLHPDWKKVIEFCDNSVRFNVLNSKNRAQILRTEQDEFKEIDDTISRTIAYFGSQQSYDQVNRQYIKIS